jgi:hypothetical protein
MRLGKLTLATFGVAGVWMVTQTLTIEAGHAWLYHTCEPGAAAWHVTAAETHDVHLPAGHQWCVTHRPYTTCHCGAYTLEWH